MKPAQRNESFTDTWIFACPDCRKALGPWGVIKREGGYCSDCRTTFEEKNDIFLFLSGKRDVFYAQFLGDYTRIRREEGRGSEGRDYYLKLPWVDKDAPMAWQWAIRAKTYQAFIARIIGKPKTGLKIVDLGAGCGWLSYRLAELGHFPCSVDISTDAYDGLGAVRHYNPTWPVVRAEFERLPLDDSQADMVIYNASFHYSIDYQKSLEEAMRVTKPDARIVILDSPVYRKRESGERMVQERKSWFTEKFGTPSDAIPSMEYLTWDMLQGFARSPGLRFKTHRVWYGYQWALRPVKAYLERKREPSTFAIMVGRKAQKNFK